MPKPMSKRDARLKALMWASLILESDVTSCDSQLRDNEITGDEKVDNESEERFQQAVLEISRQLYRRACA